MKRIWKRIVCMMTVFCMLMQPVAYVQAEGEKPQEENMMVEKDAETIPSYINPLYADVITEEDIDVDMDNAIAMFSEPEYTSSVEEIVEQIRNAMIARADTIPVYYQTEEDFNSAWFSTWFQMALAETNDSHAGDYLRWTYAGYAGSSVSHKIVNGVHYYGFNVPIRYYTTYEQEEELDEELNKVLWGNGAGQLNLDERNLSDYEKTKAIYDYVCANVEYDYDNLYDDSYTLKYTAYAALMNGTSVCQGYAALLYRMLEEVGIDTRMVAGIGITSSGSGGHAWNISKVGGKYYCSDATWDDSYVSVFNEYNYFLEGSEKFGTDHVPYDDSEAFLVNYNVSKDAYVFSDEPEEEPEEEPELQKKATLVSFGRRVFEDDGEYINEGSTLYYNVQYVNAEEEGDKKIEAVFKNVEDDTKITLKYEGWGNKDASIDVVNIDDDGEIARLPIGTYKLESIDIISRPSEQDAVISHYEFTYDGNGNIVKPEGLDAEISDYEFTVVSMDHTWPKLVSFERITPADDSAAIYKDSELKFSLNYKDAGPGGLEDTFVIFKNVENDTRIYFYGNGKSGVDTGTLTIALNQDELTVGTYRLEEIGLIEYRADENHYTFTYDRNGNMVMPEGLDAEISDYEFTVLEGTEAALNYKDVKVKSVVVNDKDVAIGENVIADITLYNPTDSVKTVYPDKWYIEWIDSYMISATGSGSSFQIPAGGEGTFQIKCLVEEWHTLGDKTIGGLMYLNGSSFNIYYYQEEGKLIGVNEDGIQIDSIPYNGEADINILEASEKCTDHVSDNVYVVKREATCKISGYEICHCVHCSEEMEETRREIPVKDHSWKSEYTVDKEATCKEAGSESIHCANCDARKDEIAIGALGHSFKVYVSDKNATCLEDGTKTAKCIRCEETNTVVDEGTSLGHTEVVDEAVEPTCTEPGLTEGSHCSVCKEVIKAQEIVEVVSHSYGAYKTTTKATFGKDGKQTATCTKCMKAAKTKVIPAVKTPTLSTTEYTFNNKAKTPSVTVKDSKGTKLSKVTSTSINGYAVTYASGRKSVGKYSVKVTLTGANYSGSKTLYFTINPKGVSISSLSKAKKAFTVKWKKPSSTYRKQMTGYQIRYSTSSKMKSAKTVTVKSTTSTSKKISKLKAKKTYYVQLRTYKKVGSKTYYSGWSSAKKVKTK